MRGINILRINKIDLMFMIPVYVLDIIIETAFAYVVWMPSYTLGGGLFFKIFYTILSGAPVALCSILIYRVFGNSPFNSTVPLLLSVAIQFLNLIVDTIYISIYNGFWQDGYIYLVTESVFAVCYLRRYCLLREIRKSFDPTDDNPSS